MTSTTHARLPVRAVRAATRTVRTCLGALGLWLALAPQPSRAQIPGPVPDSPVLQRIQQRGAIVIGHRESSVPLSYVADGMPMGYSVDICRLLAQALWRQVSARELRVAYLPVTSSTRFDAIERGEVDLECGSTTNTAARRQRVAFTIPHFIASSRLLVQAARGYDRIEDLAGAAVASTAGTTNIDSLIREAAMKSIQLDVRAARDHAEGVQWVIEGRVAAFAMDDVLLYGLRASHARPQELKVIGKPITIEPYAIAFQRGDAPLKALVDAEMRRLIRSGELHRLHERWFRSPIPPKGINLDMRMSHLLVDSLRYPTDYVPQ